MSTPATHRCPCCGAPRLTPYKVRAATVERARREDEHIRMLLATHDDAKLGAGGDFTGWLRRILRRFRRE